MEIVHYLSSNGVDYFQEWLDKLKDNQAKIAILRRIDRAKLGNMGDHESCGSGIFELRIHVGAGYRVYYFEYNGTLLVLLAGGNKKTQQSDISKAKKLKEDYIARKTAGDNYEN